MIIKIVLPHSIVISSLIVEPLTFATTEHINNNMLVDEWLIHRCWKSLIWSLFITWRWIVLLKKPRPTVSTVHWPFTSSSFANQPPFIGHSNSHSNINQPLINHSHINITNHCSTDDYQPFIKHSYWAISHQSTTNQPNHQLQAPASTVDLPSNNHQLSTVIT